MILEGKQIKLVPVESNEYAVEILSKYFSIPKPKVEEFYNLYAQEFWTIYNRGTKVGIIGYYILDGEYIVESIKDREAPWLGMVGSKEAGNLLLDYLKQPVKTSVKVEEKAIQALALKLGFKEASRDNNYIIYKKEMKTWVG